MLAVKALALALLAVITGNLVPVARGSCCGCFGGDGRKSAKIHPISEIVHNFSALFDDQQSITYFRINEAFSNRTESVVKFGAMGMAHLIVKLLDFVGWHLPLKHSGSAHTFQSIIDYFAAFEHGVDRIPHRGRLKGGFGVIPSLFPLNPY